ncbi:MAG: Mu transposase C-terminal domain-containing protein [Nitrospirota bacterium]
MNPSGEFPLMNAQNLHQQVCPPVAGADASDGVPEKARQEAIARLTLLRMRDEYRAAHPGRKKTEVDKEFVDSYNTGLIYQQLHSIVGKTSVQTLYRWDSELDGTQDWTRLVPRYYLKDKTPRLNPIEERVFLAFLLSPNKIPVGTATRFTRLLLQQRGYKTDKSDMTFRRYAEDFMAKHYDLWTLMRDGQKALRDKVEPYIKRDPSVLNVGDALVADGHRLNFQIINPFTGKPCRACMVAYIDWKSYDLAGYEIMVEENTQCVASAMRNAILRLGKTPKVAYQDNGKAFKARFFLGSPSFEEAGFYGLFGRLNIVPLFAAPYNARAKIIERWFKEFSNTFERLFPSYVGSSIADKPAYMLRNEKFHKALHNEYIPTIEETVHLLEAWLEFHRSQECPHVKGKSIGQVFDEGKGPGVDVNALDDLMMDARITRIDRNGIRFLGADYYDDNLYGLKEQVVIKYSLFDLSYVKVFAMNGEFICLAQRIMPVHPLARITGTATDYEAVKRGIAQQKRLERQTVKLAKEYNRAGGAVELDWQKVTEITPRIVEKLELEGIALPAIEEHIPDEAVSTEPITESLEPREESMEVTRLEPLKRPFFETNTERYEWHLKHGIFTDEDEAWCVWFRTTDEFRMLYSAFQNQGKEAAQIKS